MGATLAVGLATLALVAQDATPLRAEPAQAAAVHAQLSAGDLLEVRGQRLDHLQVYDHRRERAGFVRASQVRELGTQEADAPGLLAVLRFLRDTPGAESLGIAYVAAYLKAAPAAQITAEPFDALGAMAERLAQRASGRGGAGAPAHIEAVAAYGVKFTSLEMPTGRLQLCYDGEAFRRVLAMPASVAQRARAALALTRHDCLDPGLKTHERQAVDQQRLQRLQAFSPAELATLAPVEKNRLLLRQAGVWAAQALHAARQGEAAAAPAQRALDALAAVNPAELGDDERSAHAEAAVRVGAVRAAVMASVAAPALAPRLELAAGPQAGQTCVRLRAPQAAAASAAPLLERCTWARVWPGSARWRADGRALALAVQPLEGWTELWLLHEQAGAWSAQVLPPAASAPGLGYVEFAGWTPASPTPRLLLARETWLDGRASRRFEVLGLDSGVAEKSASTPQLLGAFGQWAAADWKRGTVSLR